jgi:hypothetical protein
MSPPANFDYSSIENIYIEFSNNALKIYASDSVHNLDSFFMDDTRQELAPNLKQDVIAEQITEVSIGRQLHR